MFLSSRFPKVIPYTSILFAITLARGTQMSFTKRKTVAHRRLPLRPHVAAPVRLELPTDSEGGMGSRCQQQVEEEHCRQRWCSARIVDIHAGQFERRSGRIDV